MGQFGGRGSVIKFRTTDMNIEWKVEINDDANSGNAMSEMNEINSFVWP